jgi:ketosteroid isomerase-like protein
MDLQQRREAIIRHYIDAYNRFDVEGMLRDFHPNIVFENRSGGEVNMTLEGIDAFRQQAEGATQVFSEREQQVQDITFHEDTAEVSIRYRGTLALDIPQGPQRGDRIELEGRSIFRFEGDKIVQLTDVS